MSPQARTSKPRYCFGPMGLNIDSIDGVTLALGRAFSAMILITLVSCGNSSTTATENEPVQGDGITPGETDLPEPVIDPNLGATMNLRGVVYNNTELELFWDASAEESGVVAFRIHRNQELLVASRDGLSFYDDGVEPGQSYTYEVSPLGSDDSIGTAAQVFLITPPAAPEISAANVVERFDYILSLADSISITGRLIIPAAEEGGSTDSSRGPDGLETIYECTQGGRIVTHNNDTIPLPVTSTAFEDCQSSDSHPYVLIKGEVVTEQFLSKLAWNSGLGKTQSWKDFTLDKNDGESITFSGEISDFDGENQDRESWQIEYEASAFEGKTKLSANTVIAAGTGSEPERTPFLRTLNMDIRVQSPETNNRALIIETENPFSSSSSSGCYMSGKLIATATDGSRLEADAGTGNDATFFLDVVVEGEMNRQELFWADQTISSDLLNNGCR